MFIENGVMVKEVILGYPFLVIDLWELPMALEFVCVFFHS